LAAARFAGDAFREEEDAFLVDDPLLEDPFEEEAPPFFDEEPFDDPDDFDDEDFLLDDEDFEDFEDPFDDDLLDPPFFEAEAFFDAAIRFSFFKNSVGGEPYFFESTRDELRGNSVAR
jgi:hypothetical protein